MLEEERRWGRFERRKWCLIPPEGVTVVSSLTVRLPQSSAGTGGLSPGHICNTPQHTTTHKHIDTDKHNTMQGELSKVSFVLDLTALVVNAARWIISEMVTVYTVSYYVNSLRKYKFQTS